MRSQARKKMIELLTDRSKLKKALYPAVVAIAKESGLPADKLWCDLLKRIRILKE